MPRFHIGSLRIGDWFVGMHLERVFNNVLNQDAQGKILLLPAAEKVADGLDQVLKEWIIIEPIFDAVVSNEGQSSANEAKEFITEIRDDLRKVTYTSDIPKYLEEYNFAEDENRNKFYHEFITIVFTAFSNGEFSPVELAAIGSRLLVWVKEGR